MRTTHLMTITLAAASLGFGQVKLPNMSGWKDKLASKAGTAKADTSAAPAAAPTGTPAASSAAAPSAAKEPAANITLPPGPKSGAFDKQGFELTMCEKAKREGQWDVACVQPTRMFAYKGSVTNVFGTFRFTPALTNESIRMKVQIFKNGTLSEYREVTFNPGGRTAAIGMTVTPGLYTLKVVDQYNDDKVGLEDQFVVMADTVGDRAVDNIKSGIGKLMVCSEIDDNWKCVNESSTWAANKPFNLYVRLPEAISGQVAGWAIFKQLLDGTDGQFVEDMLQGANGRAAYWATTGGHTLAAGKYTIYSIAWANRATIGNLKSYFAKTTLVVK